MTWLTLALAGGLGAVCRFWADAAVRRRVHGPVPLGTLAINVVGSFALGVLAGWLAHTTVAGDWGAVAGTGFLGGFTTFSTAAVEVTTLLREGRWGGGLALGLGMVALGLAAAALGLAAGGAL